MHMENKSTSVLPVYRLESLSDGVFAVALTLLVLNLTVPIISSPLNIVLAEDLMNLWPKSLAYAGSFFVIGIFWIGHRLMFHYIERSDRKLLWMNNLLLMFVSFIPFAANVLGTYPWYEASSVLYGGTLFLASIFYFVLWKHAVKRQLIKEGLEIAFIKKAKGILLAAPTLYLISTICGFINPKISLVLFILIPIFYILPGPVDDLVPKKEI